MANHKQSKKRNRQRGKRTALNRYFKSTMRTYVKRARTAVAEKQAEEAQTALKLAVPMIDRCAQKGVIPKATASRLVSRLTRRVNSL